MSSIIMTTPALVAPLEPDLFIIDLNENRPWRRDIAQLLVKLGQKVIENSHHEGWLCMTQVAAYCRRYRLQWQGSIKAKDLELPIRDYLEKSGEIKGGGVRVEYKTEWDEDKRRTVIFLQFRKLYPDGSSN